MSTDLSSTGLTKEEIRAAQTTPLTDEELAAAYRLIERFMGPYRTVRETREHGYPNSKRWIEDGRGYKLGTLSEGSFSKAHELVILANLLPKVLDHVRSITAARDQAVAECEKLRKERNDALALISTATVAGHADVRYRVVLRSAAYPDDVVMTTSNRQAAYRAAAVYPLPPGCWADVESYQKER